jgi:hypothetical protein
MCFQTDGTAKTRRRFRTSYIGKAMPRFYFHIRNGAVLEEDTEGEEFASLDLAYEEAVRAAREIMGEKVINGDTADGKVFEITLEDGTVLRTLLLRSVVNFE